MTGLIALVGFIGSGKDTVANMVVKKGANKDSFAHPLKDAVSAIFGWPREMLEGDTLESREFRETPDMFWSSKLSIPNFTPRLALQLVGTDVMRQQFHENIWLNSLEYRFRCNTKHNRSIVVSDARFRNELDLVRKLGGKVIWVQRGELPEWYDTAVKAVNGNAIANKIMTTTYRDIHRSEWDWVGYDVDYVIENNSSLNDLTSQVDAIYDNICLPKLKAI